MRLEKPGRKISQRGKLVATNKQREFQKAY